MNRSLRNLIRRTIFAGAALASLALSVSAGPLPPPNPADETAVSLTLIAPSDGGVVGRWDALSWKSVGAPKYTVKMTVVATGQTVKKTVTSAPCDASACQLTIDATGLFDVAQDGQLVKWSVVAKGVDGKAKSETQTFEADTVQPEYLFSPPSNDTVSKSTNLQWTNSFGAETFKLIVKNAKTGKVVLKETVEASTCSDLCSVPSSGKLKAGKQYQWFVRSIASNGDKAKSQTWSFKTYDASAAQ